MKGTSRRNTSSRRKRTLRNRLIMFVLTFSIATGIAVFGNTSLVDAHDSSQIEITNEINDNKYYKSIELQEGDTLWGIAELYMDDTYESIEDYISELKQINNLDSDEIHEGSYLMIAYNK